MNVPTAPFLWKRHAGCIVSACVQVRDRDPVINEHLHRAPCTTPKSPSIIGPRENWNRSKRTVFMKLETVHALLIELLRKHQTGNQAADQAYSQSSEEGLSISRTASEARETCVKKQAFKSPYSACRRDARTLQRRHENAVLACLCVSTARADMNLTRRVIDTHRHNKHTHSNASKDQ